MSDPDEQSLFERIGVAGGLADREGGDGFQVVVNNAGANKLDAYLGRSVRYRAEFDAASRVVVGRFDVTFTNDGPTSGLPDGVIGNYVGDPIGTNRSLVTVYTALPVTGVSIDGEQARFEAATEAGWSASRLYLVLPPGTSQTVSFSVAGQLPPGDPADPSVADTYRLVVGTQPLVLAADNDIRVTDVHGDVVLERTGKLPGIERLAAASTAAPVAPK